MKALFDIRGRQLVVETDPTVPSDTVRVHSLDAFASWIAVLDGEGPPARGVAKKAVRRVRAKVTPEVIADAGIALPQPPKGGWRDKDGNRIITGNYASREQVALAVAKNGHKLDTNSLAMLSQRFGVGGATRPHSLAEMVAMYKINDKGAISKMIMRSLKRVGVKVNHRQK